MRKGHVPVLLDAVLRLLGPPPDGVVVDCTGGGGAHARALAERMGPEGRVLVLDRDPEAVVRVEARLRGVAPRVVCLHEDFRDLDRVLAEAGVCGVDRLLADLGPSSFQLDAAARGFSFQKPGPLDMRFDPSSGVPAAELVNHADRAELERILLAHGEERHAARVAAAIVEARPLHDTVTLAEVVRRALPRGRGRIDPATRTYMAVRIWTNGEMSALDALLAKGLAALRPGGRMAVISFHGLETRKIKAAFRGAEKAGRVSLLTRRPIRPSKAEVARNPRSRSAVLRCVERVR